MDHHQGSRTSQHLLDVLEELPLGDVDASTWASLSVADHSSFRLTCRQSRHLANQLTKASHHDLHPPPPSADGGADHDGQAALLKETLWRQSVTARTAFLSRLPSLTSLSLTRWHSEVALASELLLCGAATQGRVTRLELVGQQLSADSLRAVQLALPQLHELHLVQHWSDETANPGLTPPLCHSLHGMPRLTKLSVSVEPPVVSAEWIRSLAGLATLRSLDLDIRGARFEPRCLRLVTGLHRLESCTVSVCACDTTLPDFAALLAATRLTRLELIGAWDKHLHRQDTHPPAAHAAALALLGGLTCLQCLLFGSDFAVNAATCAALRRLTQLTQLCIGRVEEEPAPAAPHTHFPHLQQLHVGWESPLPFHTLQSLLPLLPLPSLTRLNNERCLIVDISHPDSSDDEDWDGGADAAAWGVVLNAALRGLVSCPLLGVEGGLHFRNGEYKDERSLTEVAARLQPLAQGLLACVTLDMLVLEGAPWGVLHACWPGLVQLKLVRCDLSTLVLAALVGGMPALQSLDVRWCEGPEEEEGGGGWAVVAAHRSTPLQVEVGPHPVPEEVRARCRGVQQVLYGVQNIDWLD